MTPAAVPRLITAKTNSSGIIRFNRAFACSLRCYACPARARAATRYHSHGMRGSVPVGSLRRLPTRVLHIWRVSGRTRVHWRMPIRAIFTFLMAVAICSASPAWAQRLPFEQRFEVNNSAVLDVSTIRGKIDVAVGELGHVVVAGTVTVRIGWDVPSNAADLARSVVNCPPIERAGNIFRLRPPSDATERRAVTISYQVRVPPDTEVLAVSESGATTVRGISAPVTVRTQSGAIELTNLGATAGVTSGSGSMTADGVTGLLTVTTESSAIRGTSLGGGLRVRTMSGTVDATLRGTGDVDVETASSAIRMRGVRGGLKAATQSGRVTIHGVPGAPWQIDTGSGSVDLEFASAAALSLDANTRSGSVRLEGLVPDSVSKGRATGTLGRGGPLVDVTSRSGSIRIAVQ